MPGVPQQLHDSLLPLSNKRNNPLRSESFSGKNAKPTRVSPLLFSRWGPQDFLQKVAPWNSTGCFAIAAAAAAAAQLVPLVRSHAFSLEAAPVELIVCWSPTLFGLVCRQQQTVNGE